MNTPASGGRPRSQDVDNAILQAALKLFIEAGYDGTSIEAVAERAKTTRPAVYRRYAGKDELVLAALEHHQKETETGLEHDEQQTLTTLIEFWTGPEVARNLTEERHWKLMAHLIGAVPQRPDFFEQYRKATMEPRREWNNGVLRKAQDEGLLDEKIDPDILQDMFNGAILMQLLGTSQQPTAQEMQAYIKRLTVQLGLPETQHTGT